MLSWFFARLALFLATLFVVLTIWFVDANLVNRALDANQWLTRHVAGALDDSGRLQTAFRVMNMERVLLFIEIMAALLGIAIYVRQRIERALLRMRGRELDRREPPPDAASIANIEPGDAPEKKRPS